MEEKKKVAIYIRTNRRSGIERDEEIARQQRMCERAARADDEGEDRDTFIDTVSSARESRPMFDRLMRAVDEGCYKTIYTAYADRLSRNISEMLGIRARCEAANVNIVTADGMMNTSTESGRLAAEISGLLSQQESARTGERVRMGMQAARERRAKESPTMSEARAALGRIKRDLDKISRPFGYEPDGEGQLKQVPEEADEIRKIFKREAENISSAG